MYAPEDASLNDHLREEEEYVVARPATATQISADWEDVSVDNLEAQDGGEARVSVSFHVVMWHYPCTLFSFFLMYLAYHLPTP